LQAEAIMELLEVCLRIVNFQVDDKLKQPHSPHIIFCVGLVFLLLDECHSANRGGQGTQTLWFKNLLEFYATPVNVLSTPF
jgi:hypothetical protein